MSEFRGPGSMPCWGVWHCCSTSGLGLFSSLHIWGSLVGKNLYLFSGTCSSILSFSLMNFGQFLSIASCPFSVSPSQFAQLNEVCSAMLHCKVWWCLLHHAQVLLSALQSVMRGLLF